MSDPYASHIFHRTDPARVRKRLDGLYGRVASEQNQAIAERIEGRRVLDVGAGYGTLTSALKERGFDVTAIEPDTGCAASAKEWYGVDLLPRDIYDSGFRDGEFDTVVLREVVFHLEFERALREIKRICCKRVVIFQGNSSPLRKFGQWWFGHSEFNERDRDHYIGALERAGFRVGPVAFRDLLAFPLSGGIIGRPLLPYTTSIGKAVLATDRALVSFLHRIHLEKSFCFRFIITADLP